METVCKRMEAKVRSVLDRAGEEPPRIEDTLYLDLAEHIVRQATEWQRPDGMIGDPYNPPGVESVTATARYTAALGHLLETGRCTDLLEAAMRAMDWCCEELAACCRQAEKWQCANFNLKDMMVLYAALKPRAPASRLAGWTRILESPDADDLYHGGANFRFYATAAETLRIKHGLARTDWGFIDHLLQSEMEQWTTHGMYRDPNDPVTYDLTVRQGLALMLDNGYAGAHADWARLALRTAALTSLLFVSPTGVAPAGGRSAQYHMQEAMLAYLAEWQARQEADSGDLRLAGALRRMALAAAEADRRWIMQAPYVCIKNQMRDQPFHGQDGFGKGDQNAHSGYGLLAANLFAGAYRVADRAIRPTPAPADIGGYALHLADAFWRVWATVGPYHVEIDTMGQPGHDTTGLCRLHKRGVPVETALNMGIPSAPSYHMALERPGRRVAFGVGWPHGGDWRYLSAAHRGTHTVDVAIHWEGDPTELTVTYKAVDDGLHGTGQVFETYVLSGEGLSGTTRVPGADRLRLQVPLIETDGHHRSQIRVGVGNAEVRYCGHTYRVRLPTCGRAGVVEEWGAPNRNAVYRVVVFEVEGDLVEYEAVLD